MSESKERKALGRGFSALLKSVEPVRKDNSIAIYQIRIDEIAMNPKQPRQVMDAEKLDELAQSIRIKGVIQPILVRKNEGGGQQYELVAGERRLRASKLAGFEEIPAIVKSIKDKDLREIALIENIQRDDLNPIEESTAYKDLLEEHGYTQEDLARRIGKNRSTIANLIRLQQLPEVIQGDVAKRTISVGHARTLLSLPSSEEQIELRDKIINERYSVRQTEDYVKAKEKKKKTKSKKTSKTKSITEQMIQNQDRLRSFYATKVNILSKGQKGKIELEYYNEEDFNRIFSLLLKSDPG